jgi:hypothetical protein
MDGGVQSIGVLRNRKPLHHLLRQPLLRVEREAAVKARVVDGVRALGDRRDQRAEPLAKLAEDVRHLIRRHARLEVVQERVIGALDALEALEALRVAPA